MRIAGDPRPGKATGWMRGRAAPRQRSRLRICVFFQSPGEPALSGASGAPADGDLAGAFDHPAGDRSVAMGGQARVDRVSAGADERLAPALEVLEFQFVGPGDDRSRIPTIQLCRDLWRSRELRAVARARGARC